MTCTALAQRVADHGPALHVARALLLRHDPAEVHDAAHAGGLAGLARVLGRAPLDRHEVAAGPHHVHEVEDDVGPGEHRPERLGPQHVGRDALDALPLPRLEHGCVARHGAHVPAGRRERRRQVRAHVAARAEDDGDAAWRRRGVGGVRITHEVFPSVPGRSRRPLPFLADTASLWPPAEGAGADHRGGRSACTCALGTSRTRTSRSSGVGCAQNTCATPGAIPMRTSACCASRRPPATGGPSSRRTAAPSASCSGSTRPARNSTWRASPTFRRA